MEWLLKFWECFIVSRLKIHEAWHSPRKWDLYPDRHVNEREGYTVYYSRTQPHKKVWFLHNTEYFSRCELWKTKMSMNDRTSKYSLWSQLSPSSKNKTQGTKGFQMSSTKHALGMAEGHEKSKRWWDFSWEVIFLFFSLSFAKRRGECFPFTQDRGASKDPLNRLCLCLAHPTPG